MDWAAAAAMVEMVVTVEWGAQAEAVATLRKTADQEPAVALVDVVDVAGKVAEAQAGRQSGYSRAAL